MSGHADLDRFSIRQRLPIRAPGRTVVVAGVPVRMKLIRQFRQWYAVGRDVYGEEQVSMGLTRAEACASLASLLVAIRRYHERRVGR